MTLVLVAPLKLSAVAVELPIVELDVEVFGFVAAASVLGLSTSAVFLPTVMVDLLADAVEDAVEDVADVVVDVVDADSDVDSDAGWDVDSGAGSDVDLGASVDVANVIAQTVAVVEGSTC